MKAIKSFINKVLRLYDFIKNSQECGECGQLLNVSFLERKTWLNKPYKLETLNIYRSLGIERSNYHAALCPDCYRAVVQNNKLNHIIALLKEKNVIDFNDNIEKTSSTL